MMPFRKELIAGSELGQSEDVAYDVRGAALLLD
jgi:hypothetical protein